MSKVRNSIMVLIVLAFSFVALPHMAFAGVAQSSDPETEISNQQTQLVIITPEGVFLYEGEQLNQALSAGESDPTAIYDTIQQIDTEGTLTIIFIETDATLDALSTESINYLSQLASSGVIIGIAGDGDHLREKLNIFDATDDSDVPDPYNYLYFTYGAPDGARDDLLLSIQQGVTTGELLSQIVDWAREVTAKNKTLTDDGAWNATYSNDWRGPLKGGSYRFMINVFKLNTTSQTNDWYLVQASYQSAIDDYSSDLGRCGWFTRSMNLKAEVQTSNGSMLYDYMPTGTVSDTTKGFEIGAGLSTDSAGISASYSQSYSTPDVTITDKSSYVNNTAEWQVSFNMPDYTWYPFYTQPCPVARNSYQTQPAFIVQTPKNKAMKVKLSPYIAHQEDSLTFYVVVVSVKSNWWYWTDTPITITVGP